MWISSSTFFPLEKIEAQQDWVVFSRRELRSELFQIEVLNNSMSLMPHLHLFVVVVFNFPSTWSKIPSSIWGIFHFVTLGEKQSFLPVIQAKNVRCTVYSQTHLKMENRWPQVDQLDPCPGFWFRNTWCEESRMAVLGQPFVSCSSWVSKTSWELGHHSGLIL